ncbi:MAG: diacylglycerol kinase [Gammaproteobacteria bacterium]
MNDPSYKPEEFAPARGLRRLVNALRWSSQGFAATFRHEEAFRQELFLCLFLAPIGWWLGDTGVERALLIGSLLVVLIVEILNTAVESVVDRIGSEPHPLSGRAKDQGSAAVFVALLLVVVTWGLIIADKL